MSTSALKICPAEDDVEVGDFAQPHVMQVAEQATRRIAPLWPLKHFVAVNPFLGLTDRRFIDAAQVMAQAAGARMTMPRDFYIDAIASGRIADFDLVTALRRTQGRPGLPVDLSALKKTLEASKLAKPAPLATVVDIASEISGHDWSAFVIERISQWAASHFDEGQATWVSPTRHQGLFEAWRRQALIDRTPEVMGLRGFRATIASLPTTIEALFRHALARLQLDDAGLALYLHRLLMSIGGWAGFARYRVWQSELRGRSDATLLELLAVRLAWDVALLDVGESAAAVASQWAKQRQRFDPSDALDSQLAIDHLLHTAYELGWQQALLDQLGKVPTSIAAPRKQVQAVFCIDVRSEVFRRALEKSSTDIETLGFAGFFGMPLEFVPLGQVHGHAQCPVLLTPGITVRQSVSATSASEESAIINLRRVRERAASAWRWFKMAAVSSFAFVETMGWTYAAKLLTDAFGWSRPVPEPATLGLDANVVARLMPSIEPVNDNGHASGLTLETRMQLAEGALKAMSLRKGFARLVMFSGHAASSVNNPHASGLHCGACGGHSGAVNARVAAAILNDRQVRQQLAENGIVIPADTWFLGAEHDTTTDQMRVFDQDTIPATHAEDLAQLQDALCAAGSLARQERAGALNLDHDGDIDAQVLARSRDWSQVRPEWGLAGCAAFIVAPRQRTAALDLAGRSFLNSYDWRLDTDFGVLESIMTAPMVVASWINLQYYASTVDNDAFGCGNKVLHNVVGTLGVLEGNGGDLRSGLPWQSVHDGERLVHEPLRLSVVIAAPIEAINSVISKHASVRELVDNGWIHLFAMLDGASDLQRYRGALLWERAP